MIKGFIGTSLIDFPSKVAAVVFMGGCNYACPFCHNPHLVQEDQMQFLPDMPTEEVIQKVAFRSNFIDGVTISGGEPTIHGKQLIEFIKKIKKISKKSPNLAIKLDTNGSNPETIKELLDKNLLDYVALDIKTIPGQYDQISKLVSSFEQVSKTMQFLMKSSIDYEFRTTVVPTLMDMQQLMDLADTIKGCKRYVLQNFCPKGVLDASFSNIDPYPVSFFREAVRAMEEKLNIKIIARV